MPLEQTDAGLEVQPLRELIVELNAVYRETFGDDTPVTPDSFFGRLIGIISERRALIQFLLQRSLSSMSKDTALGTDLETVLSYVGDGLLPGTQSTGVLRANGTAFTTDIPNGSLVSNDIGGEQWEIVDGITEISPGIFGYEIGISGNIIVNVRAVNVGRVTFTGTDTFTIDTPEPGWTSVVPLFGGIDEDDIGEEPESDGQARSRNRTTIFDEANDVNRITKAVEAVAGEGNVTVVNNESCLVPTLTGVPAGNVEIVATGATATDISNAIFESMHPGLATFGSTTVTKTDSEGNELDVSFTFLADVSIYIKITVTNSTAEGKLPPNWETVVREAVLTFGNANRSAGQDVLYQQFIGPVYAAIYDNFSERFAGVTVKSEVSKTSLGTVAEANISISHRERARYSSSASFMEVELN